MKQTAVEWLEQEIGSNNMGTFLKEKIQQAKEIEKEQMEELKNFESWKEWKNESSRESK